MKKISNPFRDLSRFELLLWLSSMIVVTLSFLLPDEKDFLNLIASLFGVTALIFIAKGYLIGQVFVIIFAVFYGIISIYFRYYGEAITYLGMSAPGAIASFVSWMRHPHGKSREVEINRLTRRNVILSVPLVVAVTVAFYFILDALGTANLIPSTLSIATSCLAAYLTFLRSPYYALAYAANDVVLIVLWILAAIKDISYLPMIFCFVMFLFNDIYGFINWRRMRERQKNG